MKLLLDFLPLVLFFLTYKISNAHANESATLATQWLGALVLGGMVGPKEAPVLFATIVVIVATLLQVAWLRLKRRKIDLMLLISLGMIVVLGGATIWFHNETFIKLKPSAALWTFGLIILISQTFFQHNLLRSALGEKFVLPDKVWQRMNSVWVTYFGVMGLLNLWVAYSFSTDAWANFHTFGSFGLSIIFILGQGVYLNYHQSREGLDKPIP